MKRSYLEDEEMQAFKAGNDLLSISNRYKKLALTQIRYGEALTKCLTLMDELKELKKDTSCPVCYKSFMVKVTGKCDHSVCVDCYRNLVYPKKCPLCRINFENEVDDEEEDETLERDDDDDDETYDSLEDVLNVGLSQRFEGMPGTDNRDLDTEATRGGGL
jgi:hypothetical protein